MEYGVLKGKVQQFLASYESDFVEVVPGYSVNQKALLRRIELYLNSKFETGDKDTDGLMKFFFNIVNLPCDVATKAIDIDTKDFRLVPESAQAQIPTLFLQKELRDWMKENQWGDKLNEIVERLPRYGSVVVKRIKDGIEVVDLHNLACDQSAKTLKGSAMVIETHAMTPGELKRMPYDADAIKSVISLYSEKKEILVREVWGWCWRSELESGFDGKDEVVPYLYVCAGVELKKRDKGKDVNLTTTLFSAEVKEDDFPYYEVHWDRIPGRWLGRGLVEKNFDAQVRRNELQNLKGKALHWTSKLLFKTSDPTVVNNLLTDAPNGFIVKGADINQIPMQTSDLAAFASEEERWEKQVQEASFSFDTEVGQTMPSGTPFRLGALLKEGSQGFFQFKREKLGLFLRELFFSVIIPSFKKSKRRKHLISVPKDDKDRAALQEQYRDVYIYAHVQDYLEKTGFVPPAQELEMARQQVLSEMDKRPFLPVEIPDNFYDEAKFNMELVITDEQVDVAQKLETISNLIQLVAANPAVLQDEAVRNMVFAAMNLAGVSPIELGLDRALANMANVPQVPATQQMDAMMQGQQQAPTQLPMQ